MVAKRRARAALLAAAILSVTATGACTVAAPTPPEPPKPTGLTLVERTGTPAGPLDRLTWALPADITSLDPLSASDAVTQGVLANVCEPLLRMAPDASIGPGLAEVRRENSTTWVYTLRPDVRFSDGTPVTTEDVLYSLGRQRVTGAPWAHALTNVSAVELTGVREVTLRLARPDVVVNELLATAAGTVVSRSAALRAGARASSTPPVCSGPYVVSQWVRGRSVTLQRSESYWRPDGRGLARQVLLRVIPQAAQRVNDVVSGRVDGTYDVPGSALARLGSSRDVRVAYGRDTAAASIAVANFEGPLRDLRLRRALSLTVDRPAIAAAAAGPHAEPAKAPSATGQWAGTAQERRKWFVNLPPVEREVEEARRLVVEADVPDRPILLGHGPDPVSRAIAAAVQDSVVVSGLPVVLTPLPATEIALLRRDPTARTDVDAFVVVAATDVADPLQFYARFRQPETTKARGFDDRSFAEIAGRAVSEPDLERRLPLVDQLQKLVVAGHLWIPLYEHPSPVVERGRVTGAPAASIRRWLPWAALIGSTR
jgi:peptide/nickel transport system substrate-binding protein